MKLHTEKEFVTQNQLFAFKLRNLYLTNRELFYQMSDFLPHSIILHKRENIDAVYANSQLRNKCDEIETMIEKGWNYLYEISCPILLNRAKQKVTELNCLNDKNITCSYLQHVLVNKNMKFLYSDKIILNESLYLTAASFTEDLGMVGKVFESVFDPLENKGLKVWQKFQSLTKQEKNILKLLANGASNKVVGDLLFISIHTVKTHRRTIYKKLDINKTSELVRFSFALEII